MKNKKPNLSSTLEVLQLMRAEKNVKDSRLHPMLDKAAKEVDKAKVDGMLEKIMIHVGDVSRQHNILTELGVNSPAGGAQEREVFRSVLRWWSANRPESFKRNIRNIVEFTVFENLMFYQNKTDRFSGDLVESEVLMPMAEEVYAFIHARIKAGKDVELIAKHLPKYNTGKLRVTKKKAKPRKGAESYKWRVPEDKPWVTVNGEKVDGTVTLREGDEIRYPREKQQFTLDKERAVNEWIRGFCKHAGWTLKDYAEFRKNQCSAEQKMSSKSVVEMTKADFKGFLDGLTAGQRMRVSKSLCFKKGDELVPKEKWGEHAKWYIEWENDQEKIAQQIRDAEADGDAEKKEEALKNFKVKATGKQTVDLLHELYASSTRQQANNSHQALLEKMDLVANVFPIIDGSGSMGAPAVNDLRSKFSEFNRFDVAATLAVTFSTRNPVEAFRNTFGWFSSNFRIVGKSKFVNDAPNRYVSSSAYRKRVNEYNVLSERNDFATNLENLAKSNPGEIASTNIFASVEHFVRLARDGHCHVEDLPAALLYITDGERNEGKPVKDALKLANNEGWNPLLIFWAIQALPEKLKMECKGVKNVLLVNGFSESVLSQVLRGIKTGSVDPQDELWSLYENKRYSMIG